MGESWGRVLLAFRLGYNLAMPLTPTTYAQIGSALFDKDWVFPMRRLLDIDVKTATGIAHAFGQKTDYPMPELDEEALRVALEEKIAACRAALEVLGGRLAES